MAERRMMTRKVTDDDHFMALSSSAQALYLHLMMGADDDGFNNQVTVAMFRGHASVQDLQALLEARYVYQFDDGVIVIRHWRMANALRKDRYTATAFRDDLAQLRIDERGVYHLAENGTVAERLPSGCQVVAERLPDGCRVVAASAPQDSIGKDSIGKVSIGERDNAPARGFTPPTLEDVIRYAKDNSLTLDAQAFVDYYAGRGWTMGNTPMADWQAAVRNWARRDAERQTPKPAQPRKTTFHNFEQRTTAGGSWDEMQRLGETDEEYAARIGKTPEQEEGTPWDD